MAENAMELIVAELKNTASALYPERVEYRNVRIVGHTPKIDHYTYDVVVDFADGSERVAAKVYKSNKCGTLGARGMARQEFHNLQRVYGVVEKRKLSGVPRPLGDFTELGAVVAEKLAGVPLQSIIMKAALLPGYADSGTLKFAARKTGEWLHIFHRSTADMPAPFDGAELLGQLQVICESCRGEGLDEAAIQTIMGGARAIISKVKKPLPSAAVLGEFTPLNVVVGERGIGVSDYARMKERGTAFHDVAQFLASVEALEKYPFCNRMITEQVQAEFLDAYGASQMEQALLRVFKMKALLSMFAQGRLNAGESALRKKVMWATVMKRFIQQAAQRSMVPAA